MSSFTAARHEEVAVDCGARQLACGVQQRAENFSVALMLLLLLQVREPLLLLRLRLLLLLLLLLTRKLPLAYRATVDTRLYYHPQPQLQQTRQAKNSHCC